MKSIELIQEKRVVSARIDEACTQKFLEQVRSIARVKVDSIPYYRFYFAKLLDDICNNELIKLINETLHDYQTGCLFIDFFDEKNYSNVSQEDIIKLATAIAPCLGPYIVLPSGKYYDLLVSDYETREEELLPSSEDLKLHTDGMTMDNPTDWLMLTKLQERNAKGGESHFLHLEDWEDFNDLYPDPMNQKQYLFGLYGVDERKDRSRKTSDLTPAKSRLLIQDKDRRQIKFIDQYIFAETIEEGCFVKKIQDSLDNSKHTIECRLKPGSTFILNNTFWLHGRKKFQANDALYREVMRQRGCFPGNKLFHLEEAMKL